MQAVAQKRPSLWQRLRNKGAHLLTLGRTSAIQVQESVHTWSAATRPRVTLSLQPVAALSALATVATRTKELVITQSASPATTDEAARPWRRIHFSWTHERAVTLLAIALSISAFVWYMAHGQVLMYGDAVSHMMIARRVLFAHTPGLGQLGTVWPPLSHMLMLPFVWIDPLYRSGLAGALPSMACYVIATLYMFRSARLLFSSTLAGWVAALLFALNPNMLYLQSTPMTEMVLLGTVIVGLFYLLRWGSTNNALDLVIGAAALAAGSLVRYDAWVLAGCEMLVIGFIVWKRQGLHAAEGVLWLYSILAFAGVALWCIYNWMVFGNPLYFLNGPYSAKSQQHALVANGDLPTYHNIALSTHEYLQAAADMVSWPLLALALVGFVYAVVAFRLKPQALLAYGVWALLIFNVLCLILGITVIYTPEVIVPHASGYFNMRYGVMVLPEVALFVAGLATVRLRWAPHRWMPLLWSLVILASGASLFLATPATLEDAIHSTNRQAVTQEVSWLDAHYHGGTILVGAAPFSGLMFSSGLPDKAFLTEDAPSEFNTVVTTPERYATWLVMSSGQSQTYDAVQARLANRTDWRRHYILRTTINGVQFWQRIGDK